MKAKEWNKHTFGNIFEQIKKVDEELLQIQKDIIENNNRTLIGKQERLNKKRDCLI